MIWDWAEFKSLRLYLWCCKRRDAYRKKRGRA